MNAKNQIMVTTSNDTYSSRHDKVWFCCIEVVNKGSMVSCDSSGYRFYRAVDLYGQKNKQGKASILIFTCSVTHAEHLELMKSQFAKNCKIP